MKKIIRIVSVCSVLCMLLLQLSGCGISAGAADLTAGITPRKIDSNPLDDTFYTGQTAFSIALFQQAAKENAENLLLSPLSVSLALAMTANGAEGAVAQEMLSVLGGYSQENLNRYLQRWMEQLSAKENADLELANSVWFREIAGLNVKNEFLQTNVDHYDAAIFQDAFDKGTVKAVNNWVKKNTDGMIPSLLEEIRPETMLLLINALAFEAKWQTPYPDTSVEEKTFTAINGDRQSAELMCSSENQYLEDANAIGFLRPYQNGEYSFGALLPRADMTLENYIASLTGESFYTTLRNARDTSVTAYLPKFENEYSNELSDILKKMGMPAAFESGSLTAIAEMDLQIGEVLHKTYIEVEEKGTKAAAVTSVAKNDWESAVAEPMETVEVRLDRPFVYFIIDNKTDLPIFIGTVTSVE